MPKKLTTNSKAVEARVRKEEKKRAEQDKIEREKEDAFWKDEDKHVMRKANRKEEKEKKRQEVADRKALNKAAYEEEMSSIHGNRAQGMKVTRAQISSVIEKTTTERPKKVVEEPIEENINRELVEGEVARNVTEAISILSVNEGEIDRHPEKRMKAAYLEFEEKNLPLLKQQNPNMRLSQIKQMLKKDWMKSPDNPINKIHVAFNHKP
ncbi:hypothetical protein B4U80_05736 [Leptotrombidium deliense]|uniref:Coiled-coil domain-containing protein n=1 Tax=Leptotrombidium deliense TaxID=299467 RepID=A0A443SLF1_9ACAR|nr:hypothetical protein B4U80_05736 [Leptotrombidium deliense]